MSLAISLDDGALEYSGDGLSGVFAQKRNLVSPRFWSMLRDLRRFYREAPGDLGRLDETRMTLGAYLKAENYSEAFRDDHLLPMAAAIWSAPPHAMLNYPAASFVRFQENHGLLKLTNRPVWRTVTRRQPLLRRPVDGAVPRPDPAQRSRWVDRPAGGASRSANVTAASHDTIMW